MTSRKIIGILVFLTPFALSAMAVGWKGLIIGALFDQGVSSSAPGTFALQPYLGTGVGLVAGPLIDWRGSRLLIVAGGLAAALGFLIISTASSMSIVLIGGFLVFAGVGLAGGVAIQVLIADWFIQYRGTFLGLALLGSGLGSRLAPALWVLVFDDSWRVAAVVLALGGVGVSVAGLTLIHSSPARREEEDSNQARVPGRRPPQLERTIPAGRYVRNSRLWGALVLLALASAAVVGIESGLRVMARVLALENPSAYGIYQNALLPVGMIVGGFGWSVATDFWPRKRLFWQSGLAAVASVALLGVFSHALPDGIGTWTLLILAGLFLGGLSALITVTFVDYMGVRLLGTLNVAFGLISGLGRFTVPIVTRIFFHAFGISQAVLLMVPLVVFAVLAATWAPFPRVELDPAPQS